MTLDLVIDIPKSNPCQHSAWAGLQHSAWAGLGLDLGRLTCHITVQSVRAEGGQTQVQLTYLGLPTLLLGRAQFGMPKKLIDLATAGVPMSKHMIG